MISNGGFAGVTGLLVALGLCLVTGCNKQAADASGDGSEVAKGEADQSSDGADEADAEAPSTRDDFLRLFARLPDAPIHVHYAVSGPRMSGTLDLWVDEGGYRREAWSLEMPSSLDEGADLVAVAGLAIQTPEVLWSAVEGESGVKRESPLGAIADRYLALSAEDKDAVATTLRAWSKSVEKARSESPGETDTIAGIECLEMHVGSQDLCLWEQAGLPLQYRGEAFVLEAQTVERHVELPVGAFELPGVADGAIVEDADESALDVDPKEAIEQLKSGNPGVNALALTPAFRLPTPSP